MEKNDIMLALHQLPGFSFDLQRFADGGGDGGDAGAAGGDNDDDAGAAGGDNGGDDAGNDSNQNDDAAVQARIDAAVTAAQKKWEKSYQKKAAAAKKEADRLSKLSEDERAKEELEASRKELEARDQELTRKELKLEMVKVLAKRNIPVQFMDYLIAEDNESTLKRITDFEKEFKKAIEAGVNEKLKGKAPQAGGSTLGGKDGTGVKNGFFDAIYKNQAKR